MEQEPLVVTPEDSVDYARDAMTKSHTSHLVVLDGHKLAGVISFHDVARACLKEANFENALLKRYIKHWPDLAHGREDFQRVAQAVFQAAAVFVIPRVGQRREELVQQVAVGRVDFDGVQAESVGASGRFGEGFPDADQSRLNQGVWRCVVAGEGQGGGRHGTPAAIVRRQLAAAFPGNAGGGFAAGVGELDGDGHVGIPAQRFQDPAQSRFRGIRPEPQVGR
jgi:hypothetical protein